MTFLDWLQNDTAGLLPLAAVSVALLLIMIMRLRLEPFIALIVTGVLVALVAGVSVTDLVGTPIKASDLEIGDLVNAEPEAIFPTEENGYPEIEGVELYVAKSKAAVVVVRMDPDDVIPGEGRDNWSVDGIVCYSKICTHVGCPISLYERTTHHLLCPCHQSTFDLADSGRVVFGPAGRHLPQLPLAVDAELGDEEAAFIRCCRKWRCRRGA